MRWLATTVAALTLGGVLGATQSALAESPCDGPEAAGLLCPNLRIGRRAKCTLQDGGSGRKLLRATSDVRSRGRGPIELRGQRNGWRTMRTVQRIYRAGGGHLDVRSGATLRFTGVGAYFGGFYWKVHQLARFDLRRVGPDGRAGRRRSHQPQAQLLPARPRADRPGQRATEQPPLPRLQPEPVPGPGHARDLGWLVGHLPRALPSAVDQRRRPARLLRLRDDRRPAGTALRVQRGRQHLGPHRAAALPRRDRLLAKPDRGQGTGQVALRERSLAQDLQEPSSSIAAMSTTVDGSPVSSPPSIARSAPATISSGTSSKRPGAGSPLRFAEVWKTGHMTPASGPASRRTPSRSAVLAAGQRIALLGVGDDQRHRPRQQRADGGRGARAEPGDQLPHRQRREVHDRRGLAVVAPLEAVDTGDRRRVERVAGEAVEPVGGEHGDAAAGDAAFQRRARDLGAVALERNDLGRARRRRSSLPHHHPLDPGQVAADLRSRRSRRR